MIEASKYISTAKSYFNFLVIEFGFQLFKEKVRGNVFYDIQYRDDTRIVSISYENIEGYFQVIVFVLKNGELPEYDDKVNTLHLDKLNAKILSNIDKSEIVLNGRYFEDFQWHDEFEKKMLKCAKELRLCLKHFKN